MLHIKKHGSPSHATTVEPPLPHPSRTTFGETVQRSVKNVPNANTPVILHSTVKNLQTCNTSNHRSIRMKLPHQLKKKMHTISTFSKSMRLIQGTLKTLLSTQPTMRNNHRVGV